jgi:hypothetical protein
MQAQFNNSPIVPASLRPAFPICTRATHPHTSA